jgi:RimJ/RimL family protein N-acetyltransferase
MSQKGYRRLYARIWHSNHPSIATFEKAGWAYIALVIEVFPLGLKSPWRLVRRRRAASKN